MLTRGVLPAAAALRGRTSCRRRLEPARVLAGLVAAPALDAVAALGREQRAAMRGRRRRRDAARRLALRLAAVSSSRAARRAPTCAGSACRRADHVAPNAVDFRDLRRAVEAERATAALRERLGLDGCVFLYVGRLEREKGLDVLVEAMRDVPATLVLAGSGPLEPELRAGGAYVASSGSSTRDELVPWYAAADVLRRCRPARSRGA